MDYLGELKLALVQSGLFIPSFLVEKDEIVHSIWPGIAEHEIVLNLGEDFSAKTVLTSGQPEDLNLIHRNKNFHVVINNTEQAVGLVPPPVFHRKQYKLNTPFSNNVNLDGYCLNINLRFMGKENRLNLNQGEILSLIQEGVRESRVELVQFNLDYCPSPDRGFGNLIPMIRSIKKNTGLFLSLRGLPPEEKRKIDKIYAAGIDLLDFPLEGFSDPEYLEQIMPQENIFQALEYAAGIFPKGAVFTELVTDNKSLEDTHSQISRLAKVGVIPILDLRKTHKLGGIQYTDMLQLVRHLKESVRGNKTPLKWLFPMNHFVSPLDANFFLQKPSEAKLATRPIYRSLLGKKASEGFAAMRRKLRVQDISDSYESAGL